MFKKTLSYILVFTMICMIFSSGYRSVIAADDGEPRFEVVNVTDRTATLEWDPIDEAVSYSLHLNGVELFDFTAEKLSHDVINMSPNMEQVATLYYQKAGGAEFSITYSFTTKPLDLRPPANLQVSNITTNSADIEWDHYPYAFEYEVAINNEFEATVRDGQSSYSFSGLEPGTTYYVEVYASYGGNQFSVASEIDFTTEGLPEEEVPEAPTGLTATAGNAEVSLVWNAVTGEGNTYNVKRSTTSGGPYTTIASDLTEVICVDETAANGTTYYYVVTVVNTDELESTPSSEVSAQPVAPAPPEAPIGLAATAGNAEVSLVWNAIAGEGNTYNVKRSTTSGGPYTTIAPDLTEVIYVDESAANGTTYYYVVTVVSTDELESTPSSEVSAQPVAPPAPPEAPTGLAATAGNGQVSLVWNEVTGEGNSYTVKRSTMSGGSYTTIATDLTEANYVDELATNGTTYYYVVTVVNTDELESTSSNEVSAQPVAPAPPEAPTGLAATAGNGQVSLVWNEVAGEGNTYNVKRSTTSGGPYTVIATDLTVVNYVDTTVDNGTTYYYVVTVVSTDELESTSSNEVSAQPVAPAPPEAPTGLAATAGNGQVSLVWNEVTGEGNSFTVKRSTTSGGPYTVIATDLTVVNYVDTTVDNGTTYYYVVSVVNTDVLESTSSNEVSAQPVAPLPPVTDDNPIEPSDDNAANSSSNNGTVPLKVTYVTEQTAGGKTVTKGTIDPADFQKTLDSMKSGNEELVILVPGETDAYSIQLSVSMIQSIKDKFSTGASIVMKSSIGSYVLPVSAVNTESIAKSLGTDKEDLNINISMEKANGDIASDTANVIKELGGQMVSDVVDYSVTVESKSTGKSTTLDQFNQYVKRSINVNKAVDSSKSTGVLYDEATKSFSFVPATFSSTGNGTVATLKRNGNSIYLIIEFSKTFEDLNGHWAKADVELLASKLIVKGTKDERFEPNGLISRAEFTSLLVTSMGLSENDTSRFSDVKSNDWYAGAVNAAAKAGFVDGYEDGTFMPNEKISREQMVVMIMKAMSFTGYETTSDSQDLSDFTDSTFISSWAKDAFAKSVSAGVITGRTSSNLAPAAHASRAEAVVMLKRMLQALEFIN